MGFEPPIGQDNNKVVLNNGTPAEVLSMVFGGDLLPRPAAFISECPFIKN